MSGADLPSTSGAWAKWVAIVALLASTASCSGTGWVDGPVLVSPRPSLSGGGGMTAEIRGMVVYDERSQCILLELGDSSVPVVWPAGASWRADPPAVELQGQAIEPGMLVEGGGGYLKEQHIRELAGTAVAAAPAACAGPTGEVAFFNSGSAVTVVTD